MPLGRTLIFPKSATGVQINFFVVVAEFGVHLAELTVDREGALAIRQVSHKSSVLLSLSLSPPEPVTETFEMVYLLSLWMKSYGVTVQMKPL